jgi:L-histidine Nalpha-methyltransferase / hercynylcysteine S-oxide synthase
VDNPELCHDHSEIPDSWPPLDEILKYSNSVRARITESIESGQAFTDRRLGRGLWLAYEHEAMHLETFVYMLLQSERVLPPPGRDVPDFGALAAEARARRVANEWHRVPSSTVTLGLDDAENNDGPNRYFGWDNEKPTRNVQVGEFEVQGRPISNGEYAHFLEKTEKSTLPASWKVSTPQARVGGINGTNGINGHRVEPLQIASASFVEDKAVRTVYGLVPLKYALDWPVMASYDELAAYAEWSDGRIPTLEEARSLYNYVDQQAGVLQKVTSKLISAVNG